MLDFFARFHLLVVHLPVAILLLAVALTLFSPRNRALRIVWLAGSLSAALACATGWFLAATGGFEADTLQAHRGFGLALAATAAVFCYFLRKNDLSAWVQRLYAATTGFFVLAALHLGATLTHGENYLFEKAEIATASLTLADKGNTPAADLPADPAPPADPKWVKKLEDMGVLSLPVAAGSHYLSINCVNAGANFSDTSARHLEPLAAQIAWLNLGSTAISDSALASVGRLAQLSRLRLDHAKIGDPGLLHLKNLKNLRLLNLSGTSVSATGIMALRDLPKLEKIYLYGCSIKAEEWLALRSAFPKTEIDTGGYAVPTLPGDTIMLKAPKK